MASSKRQIRKIALIVFLTGCLLVSTVSGCGAQKELPQLPVYPAEEPLRLPQGEPISNAREDEKSDISEENNDNKDVRNGEEGIWDEELHEEENISAEELVEEDGRVTITISAAGDCSLGNHATQDYNYSFRQTYEEQQNPGYFFENVKSVFENDDCSIVNLEGVLSYSTAATGGKAYNIEGDPQYAHILTLGNVEVVSMANNHRLDYGEGGTADTVAALEEEGILYAYDSITTMYEVKGIAIGIVSVNMLSGGAEKYAKEGIETLQANGADLILACCHWGIEKDYYPNSAQQGLGRKCIDWGADLVIGHHPHVLQGIECYQGKYIIYSLGNFCFGANRNPIDKDTMIFRQTFTFEEGAKLEEAPAQIVPCLVSSIKERNDYKPTVATGEEATRVIDHINQLCSPFGTFVDEEGNLSISQ